MIIVCTHCKTKSKLDDKYAAKKSLKVRCTKCRKVFKIFPALQNNDINESEDDFSETRQQTKIIEGISTIIVDNNIIIAILPWESIDISNKNEFKEKISAVIKDYNKIIFDMVKVEFMDSSGCGALISYARKIKNNNGTLKLCNISDQVHSIFDLIQLNRYFDIYSGQERAINSFY